jgi:hypothetical protein
MAVQANAVAALATSLASPQDYHRFIATNAADRVHPRTTDEIRSEPALARQAVIGLAS